MAISNDAGIRAWDGRYQDGTHTSAWPWTELVQLIERHAKPLLATTGRCDRILELGFGFGANIPYLIRQGAEYHGIDGSPTCANAVAGRFPEIATRLHVGDFCKELPDIGPLDLVVDRGSLTCCPNEAIAAAMKLVLANLRPGGVFCGVSWFGKDHAEFIRGEPGPDPHTRQGYTDGPYANTGTVHFTDEHNLRDLCEGFRVVRIDRKTTDTCHPERRRECHFNLLLTKTN
jgi:SAM-dependent methyltransferase